MRTRREKTAAEKAAGEKNSERASKKTNYTLGQEMQKKGGGEATRVGGDLIKRLVPKTVVNPGGKNLEGEKRSEREEKRHFCPCDGKDG